jgi:hypothetical protein
MKAYFKCLESPGTHGIINGVLFVAVIIISGLLLELLPVARGLAEEVEKPTVLAEDEVFALRSDGVVIDKKRNLMWARADNGKKISIDDAKTYVKSFILAGFTDWRIPDIQELESLKVKNSSNNTLPTQGCGGDYEIHPFFQLTCCCPWALQDAGTRPAAYPFVRKVSSGSMWHHKSNSIGNRILPVRDMK